jgi:hypothetical protein
MTEETTLEQKKLANDLIKTVLENTSKFVYFLLSITTVSIGYAITATATDKMEFSHRLLLWGASMIAMGYSTHCGIKSLNKTNELLITAIKSHQENISENYQKYFDNATTLSKEAHELMIMQQRILYIGYIGFFAWHISNILTK